MMGLNYFKAEPTEFVRMTSGGKEKRKGTGIAGIYMPMRTSIEMVSVTVNDDPFTFSEISSDNQELTFNGGFVYQITEPELVMQKYNFSIDPKTKMYLNEDGMQISDHMLQLVRTNTRKIVESKPLEDLLVMSEELAGTVTQYVQESDTLTDMGVTFDSVYINAMKPKPEISKALEAEYRESLLQRSDEAIYSRRAMAVEKERAIQENEMQNQIELEEKRTEFVDLEGANKLKDAQYKADAMKKEFEAYNGMDAAILTAHGMYNLGKNAHRIENLTITPELLAGIMRK